MIFLLLVLPSPQPPGPVSVREALDVLAFGSLHFLSQLLERLLVRRLQVLTQTTRFHVVRRPLLSSHSLCISFQMLITIYTYLVCLVF